MKPIIHEHDERVKILYTLVQKRIDNHSPELRKSTPYHGVLLVCGYGTGTVSRALCIKSIERMYKHPKAAPEHKRVYGACLRLLRRA